MSTATPQLVDRVTELVSVHKEIVECQTKLKAARKRYKKAVEDVRDGMRGENLAELRSDAYVVRRADTCQLNITEA